MSKPTANPLDAIINRLETRRKKAAHDAKTAAKLAATWRRLRAKQAKSAAAQRARGPAKK